MPRDNRIQEEEGSSSGASPLVEAWPADEVERIANVLRSRQANIPWAALLFHVGLGETPSAIRWLDDLANYWAESVRDQQPWGVLAALPQIVVEADNETPDCREKFLEWGISSFADKRTPGEIIAEMREAITGAGKSGAFAVTPVETGTKEDQSQEAWAPPEAYAEALRALTALGKAHERED